MDQDDRRLRHDFPPMRYGQRDRECGRGTGCPASAQSRPLVPLGEKTGVDPGVIPDVRGPRSGAVCGSCSSITRPRVAARPAGDRRRLLARRRHGLPHARSRGRTHPPARPPRQEDPTRSRGPIGSASRPDLPTRSSLPVTKGPSLAPPLHHLRRRDCWPRCSRCARRRPSPRRGPRRRARPRRTRCPARGATAARPSRPRWLVGTRLTPGHARARAALRRATALPARDVQGPARPGARVRRGAEALRRLPLLRARHARAPRCRSRRSHAHARRRRTTSSRRPTGAGSCSARRSSRRRSTTAPLTAVIDSAVDTTHPTCRASG